MCEYYCCLSIINRCIGHIISTYNSGHYSVETRLYWALYDSQTEAKLITFS